MIVFRFIQNVPSKEKFWVALSFHAFFNQLCQQSLQDVRTIFHSALQGHHYERSNIDPRINKKLLDAFKFPPNNSFHKKAKLYLPVSHREISIAFESANEEEQESLVHDELAKKTKALLLPDQFWPVDRQHGVVVHVREQDLHGVSAIVEEGDASRREVTGQISHLGLQLSECLLALGSDTQLQNVHLLLHVLEHAVALGRLATVQHREDDADERQDETDDADADDDLLGNGAVNAGR